MKVSFVFINRPASATVEMEDGTRYKARVPVKLLDAAMVETIVGSVATLIGAVWSIVAKKA